MTSDTTSGHTGGQPAPAVPGCPGCTNDAAALLAAAFAGHTDGLCAAHDTTAAPAPAVALNDDAALTAIVAAALGAPTTSSTTD